MIYAKTANEVMTKRRQLIAKWRLKHRRVANSLEEADENLFTFLRVLREQWKSARTTNAIEGLHEEFRRLTFLSAGDSLAPTKSLARSAIAGAIDGIRRVR